MKLEQQENLDLGCSMYVQSSLTHREFVSYLADVLDASTCANIVENDVLDISVDDNDDHNPELSTTGKDRWLHFRYRLEIDPSKQLEFQVYLTAISTLLNKLWSSGMDAVAACDFEEDLPPNIRRSRWQ